MNLMNQIKSSAIDRLIDRFDESKHRIIAAASEIHTLPSSATDIMITHSNFTILRTYAIDAKRQLRSLDLRANNITVMEPRSLLMLDMLEVTSDSMIWSEKNSNHSIDLI